MPKLLYPTPSITYHAHAPSRPTNYKHARAFRKMHNTYPYVKPRVQQQDNGRQHTETGTRREDEQSVNSASALSNTYLISSCVQECICFDFQSSSGTNCSCCAGTWYLYRRHYQNITSTLQASTHNTAKQGASALHFCNVCRHVQHFSTSIGNCIPRRASGTDP